MPLPPLESRPRRLNVGDLMAVTAIAALPMAAIGTAASAGRSVPEVLALTVGTLAVDGLIWRLSWRAPGRAWGWSEIAVPLAVAGLALVWFVGLMVLFFNGPESAILVAATALALRAYVVTWG